MTLKASTATGIVVCLP